MKCMKSLPVTRFAVLVLIVFAIFQHLDKRRLSQHLDYVNANALWRYPFRPPIDKNFKFSADYYGLHYDGNYIEDWELLFFGAPEKPDLFFMSSTISKLKPQGGVFTDIGSNKGLHSLFMSQYAKKIIAFDPYPPVNIQFKKNIEKNHIGNITLIEVGLGDKNGSIPFFEPPDIFGGSFSSEYGYKIRSKNYAYLPIRVGDEVLEKLNLPSVDIIKIDIEGYEKIALKGLKKTLTNFRPVVVMEHHAASTIKEAFKSESELHSVFPEGYEFLQYDLYEVYRGTYRLVKHNYDQRQKDSSNSGIKFPRNIVAYPKEKAKFLVLER